MVDNSPIYSFTSILKQECLPKLCLGYFTHTAKMMDMAESTFYVYLDKIITLTSKTFSLSHNVPTMCIAYSSTVKNGFEISSIPSLGLTNETCVPRTTTKPSLRVALVSFSISMGSVRTETTNVSIEL